MSACDSIKSRFKTWLRRPRRPRATEFFLFISLLFLCHKTIGVTRPSVREHHTIRLGSTGWVERLGRSGWKRAAWTDGHFDQSLSNVSCPLDSHGRLLASFPSTSSGKGPSVLKHLNDNFQDVSFIFPFHVNGVLPIGNPPIKYWRVMPHPCSDPGQLVPRLLSSDGFGFEKELFTLLGWANSRPGPPPVVVDIGANLGAYTALAGSLGYRVHAVEVQERRIRELMLMKHLNSWDDVTIHHGAIGTKADVQKGTSLMCPLSPFSTLLGASTEACETVLPESEEKMRASWTAAPLISPDAVIHEDILFMKVDCDGCEVNLFANMMDVLSRHRVAYMLVEVGSEDLWLNELIGSHNYAAFVVTSDQSFRELPQDLQGKIAHVPDEGSNQFQKVAELFQSSVPSESKYGSDLRLSPENMLSLFQWLQTGRSTATVDVFLAKL
mmetsp:Transcript_13656/g.59590  ORF Transcript_13656/g.59590 Transcript_13656/m.59590 type:complete len:439 (+) Transcript_13656:76-1392(+)